MRWHLRVKAIEVLTHSVDVGLSKSRGSLTRGQAWRIEKVRRTINLNSQEFGGVRKDSIDEIEMRIGYVWILKGGRHGKICMMEDGVERFFHLLAHQEDPLALVVGRVGMWRDASVKRMTNASVKSIQVKD